MTTQERINAIAAKLGLPRPVAVCSFALVSHNTDGTVTRRCTQCGRETMEEFLKQQKQFRCEG
jgi:hypothetical protein